MIALLVVSIDGNYEVIYAFNEKYYEFSKQYLSYFW